jgi:hypothetical protein
MLLRIVRSDVNSMEAEHWVTTSRDPQLHVWVSLLPSSSAVPELLGQGLPTRVSRELAVAIGECPASCLSGTALDSLRPVAAAARSVRAVEANRERRFEVVA